MSSNVTLISMSMVINAYDIRLLSAALRKAGFGTQKILLPNIYPYSSAPAYNFGYCYEDSIVDDIVRLARNSTWIGLSVNTNMYIRAKDLTRRLKERTNIPIVWGGVHVSAKPEECAENADYVALGEGEDTAVEITQALAEGKDPLTVPGVGAFRNGEFVSSYRSLDQKTPLEELSWADYSLDNEWIQDKEARRLRKLDLNLFTIYAAMGPAIGNGRGPIYFTAASRGCTHRCSYCIHSLLARKFPEFMKMRIRPVDDVIAELVHIKETLPSVIGLYTIDEDFFALGDEWIEEYCRKYKAEVKMPFKMLCSINNVTEERMKMLVDAGMIWLKLGIQSITKRMSAQYNRKWASEDLFMEKIKILNSFKDRLMVEYDVIVDNPEETEDEERETFLMVTRLPKPFMVALFTLTYFPGSLLYEHAKKTGLLTDEINQVYLKSYIHPRPKYLTFLYMLLYYHVPPRLLRLLASKFMFNLFRGKGFERLYGGIKGSWHKLIGADTVPIYQPDPKLISQRMTVSKSG